MSQCGGSCPQPNQCSSAPRGVCEKKLEINEVPNACGQYSLYFDGQYQDTLDVASAVSCAETNTEMHWNEKKCRIEFHNENFIKTKGTGTGLWTIEASKILECASLCDLKDFCCDVDPKDCDVMIYKDGKDEDGCPGTGCAGWQPYTTPVVSEMEFLGGFDGSCPVKLDCSCADDADDCVHQVIYQDGVFKCDEVIECVPSAGVPAYTLAEGTEGLEGTGTYATTGSACITDGTPASPLGTVAVENNTDCPMRAIVTVPLVVCATTNSTDFDFEVGAYACITGANFLNGTTTTVSQFGAVSSPASPSGFQSVNGTLELKTECIPAGGSVEIEFGNYGAELLGTIDTFVSTVGYTGSGNANYTLVPPTYELILC